MGERGRGGGEDLQDPADHLHPPRKPAGLRRGEEGVAERRGAEVHRDAAVDR